VLYSAIVLQLCRALCVCSCGYSSDCVERNFPRLLCLLCCVVFAMLLSVPPCVVFVCVILCVVLLFLCCVVVWCSVCWCLVFGVWCVAVLLWCVAVCCCVLLYCCGVCSCVLLCCCGVLLLYVACVLLVCSFSCFLQYSSKI